MGSLACLTLTEKQIEDISAAFSKLADAIIEVWQKIVEVMTAVLKSFWDALREFLKRLNPKIYNLAYNHKKAKVRKKNQSRLFKLFKRLLKYPKERG